MAFRVVPFNAQVQDGEGAATAAAQLEALVNKFAERGWVFQGLEQLDTTIVTPAVPGDNGCLGIGATPYQPEQRDNTAVYVAVFQR